MPFSLRKALARKAGEGGDEKLAPLVCVFGPKGGTGKTITATNVGVSLATSGHNASRGPRPAVRGRGARARPDARADDLRARAVGGNTGRREARQLHDKTPVGSPCAPRSDSSRPGQGCDRGLFAACTPCCVVVERRRRRRHAARGQPRGDRDDRELLGRHPRADTGSARTEGAKLALETLGLLHYQQSKINIVLARTGSHEAVSDDDVRTIPGRAPDTIIPGDPDVPRSLQEGRAVVQSRPKSEAAQALARLATQYSVHPTTPAANASAPRRRLFGRAG